MKNIISAPNAPAPAGPYSQGTESCGLVFTSGQLPVNPDGTLLGRGDMRAAAMQAFANMLAVLDAAGCSARDVLKVTVFLADMADFGAMNEAWSEIFPQNPPARSCVQVAALPRGTAIEVEAVAAVSAAGARVRNL